jgi:ABC-type nitrate/sulfonate/bicarbonate transport system substrate-binding protein
MKKLLLPLTGLVVIILFIVFYLIINVKTNVKNNQVKDSPKLTNLRVGWQTPWAIQGQLVQILKHKNILNQYRLSPTFFGFNSGAPLNEAAMAGSVDVILTADQPAATLISKNSDWVIIGRLMYNRVSLYVPPNSPITEVAQLKEKTVAMPFGAAAQRMAYKAEKDAGLEPGKDVKNINLGIYEQSDLVKDKTVEKWGEIDALAGFDPTPAIFEEKGLIRNLKTAKVTALILMSKKYIQQNPTAPHQLLMSFVDAYDFYRFNISTANTWFNEESHLLVSDKAFSIAESMEPNFKVTSKNEINLSFTDEDYLSMQDAADFLLQQKLITTPVQIKDHVDISYINQLSK